MLMKQIYSYNRRTGNLQCNYSCPESDCNAACSLTYWTLHRNYVVDNCETYHPGCIALIRSAWITIYDLHTGNASHLMTVILNHIRTAYFKLAYVLLICILKTVPTSRLRASSFAYINYVMIWGCCENSTSLKYTYHFTKSIGQMTCDKYYAHNHDFFSWALINILGV